MRRILISIRPQFANEILDGSKRYELRRRDGAVSAGDELVIYSSSPTRCIVGTCKVVNVWSEPRRQPKPIGQGHELARFECHTSAD